MTPTIHPLVIDLSHHNTIDVANHGFTSVYAAGYRGIIHKASQGHSMVDGTYAARRLAAKAAGLLWGAYHFGDNSDVDGQVRNFMHAANPDANTLLALDFEGNGAHTMTLAQARAFLAKIDTETGRKAVLYSGNLIKEQMPKADPFFNSHRLWLAQYGPMPKMPAGWSSAWLWQFTGDGVGPLPHRVPGIVDKGLDINSYAGTPEQLAAEWAGIPTGGLHA